MKEQKGKRIKRPISIKTINILMISAAVAIIVILILLVVNIQKKYNSLRANTDIYLMCQREAPMMTKASDYLTQQVRSFAVTGETEYINNYFTEVDVNLRREKAIEFLEPYMKDTPAIRYLESALEASNELMEIEYYSMILEWESLGLDRVYIPEDIKNLKLTADDAALSSEEKHQKAIEIVFDETYQSYKDTVNADVDSCQNELIEILDTEHNRSYESLTRLLVLLFIMLVIMLIVILAVILISLELVMNPLIKAANFIKEQQKVPLSGASEMQFLAEAYNDAFEKTRKIQDDLQHEAMHDALTGLFNRAGYNKLIEELNEESMCLLLIDVDKFKSVNDQYGHDIGDLVLKKAADVLKHQFRSDDLIFRFGGDEFAVIMRHAGPNLTDLIKIKVGNANRQLGLDDKLPATSFSVGAAFGSGTMTDELFKGADTALYKVKNAGGCGVEFASDSE